MAKKKEESKEVKPLVWTQFGELEATYSEPADRVFVRQKMQGTGMRLMMAELEGGQPMTTYVAATSVHAFDRDSLKLLVRLFPAKGKK